LVADADPSLRKHDTLPPTPRAVTMSAQPAATSNAGSSGSTGALPSGPDATVGSSSDGSDGSTGGWFAVASDATELTVHERIGAGAVAVVHRAAWRGSEIAVKIWNPTPGLVAPGTPLDPSFMREVQLLSSLRHPNILAIYALVKAPRPMMIMELGAAGSLKDVLARSSLADLGWRRRVGIATQVACGVEFLHAQSPPIIHTDLKCGNIVLNESLVPKARAAAQPQAAPASACVHTYVC
jgi:serine/threonine protein kinase